MRLAFLDLPDDRVDLISLARQTSGVEIVLVCHPDPEALALKIAEVPGQGPRAAPEFESVRVAAERSGRPLREVAEAAVRAWQEGERSRAR